MAERPIVPLHTQDFPNASVFADEHPSEKPEKPVPEKIIKGEVSVKKTSLTKRIGNIILQGETWETLGDKLLTEVIIPQILSGIADIIQSATDMIFLGKVRSKGSKSKYNFNSLYNGAIASTKAEKITDAYDSNIVMETKEDADELLEQMLNWIETYGTISVADMKNMVGTTCNHTDYRFGWTNLRSARVIHTRDGWELKLPAVEVVS